MAASGVNDCSLNLNDLKLEKYKEINILKFKNHSSKLAVIIEITYFLTGMSVIPGQ